MFIIQQLGSKMYLYFSDISTLFLRWSWADFPACQPAGQVLPKEGSTSCMWQHNCTIKSFLHHGHLFSFKFYTLDTRNIAKSWILQDEQYFSTHPSDNESFSHWKNEWFSFIFAFLFSNCSWITTKGKDKTIKPKMKNLNFINSGEKN